MNTWMRMGVRGALAVGLAVGALGSRTERPPTTDGSPSVVPRNDSRPESMGALYTNTRLRNSTGRARLSLPKGTQALLDGTVMKNQSSTLLVQSDGRVVPLDTSHLVFQRSASAGQAVRVLFHVDGTHNVVDQLWAAL